jgi:hypothetical protein
MRAGPLTVSPSAPASATTDTTTATGNITLDSTQPFTLANTGSLQPALGLGAFDANGADKLVVVVSSEHGFNNGQGYVTQVLYNGTALTEAVQEDAGAGRGTAAIFYLDNPGPIGAGTIEVEASGANGGGGAAYALSGTKPGVGVTNRITGDSVASLDITTAGDNSLVIAVIENSGNANAAGTPTTLAPLTQVSSGFWGSQWGGHASGYQQVSSPSTITASFSTNTGSGYSINIAAAEFLAGISTDYLAWDGLYPAADLSDPGADFDGDGLNNEEERLFGLDPTSASSINPISTPLDAAGNFSYTRRDDALSGKTYSIWYSTTLQPGSWFEDTGAVQIQGTPDANGVETISGTLTPALLTNDELFIRVGAN